MGVSAFLFSFLYDLATLKETESYEQRREIVQKGLETKKRRNEECIFYRVYIISY